MKQYLKCLIVVVSLAIVTTAGTPPQLAKTGVETAQITKHGAVAKAPKNAQPNAKPAPKKKPVADAKPTPKKVPAKPPVPAFTAGCAQYLPLIKQYDWSVPVAMAIMHAESNCDPYAVSPANYDGLRDYGLFQIHGEYIIQPTANVARAYQKYQSQGWGAWTAYNTGRYLQYLQ